VNLRPSQLPSLLAATYVAVVLGGIFVHFVNTGDLHTLRYSLTLPATLIATTLGSVIAFGLWQEHAWAWWLGLVVVSLQLLRFGPWLLAHINKGSVQIGSWLIGFLLLTFLVSLLTPAVRKSCSR